MLHLCSRWQPQGQEFCAAGVAKCHLRVIWRRGGFDYRRLAQVPMKHYTSAIIACVCAGYKRIRSQAIVSMVSLIDRSSEENGIAGISEHSYESDGCRPDIGVMKRRSASRDPVPDLREAPDEVAGIRRDASRFVLGRL